MMVVLTPAETDPEKIENRMVKAEKLLFFICREHLGHGGVKEGSPMQIAIDNSRCKERKIISDGTKACIADGQSLEETLSSGYDGWITPADELKQVVRETYEEGG
jgi:hypothetical protein